MTVLFMTSVVLLVGAILFLYNLKKHHLIDGVEYNIYMFSSKTICIINQKFLEDNSESEFWKSSIKNADFMGTMKGCNLPIHPSEKDYLRVSRYILFTPYGSKRQITDYKTLKKNLR